MRVGEDRPSATTGSNNFNNYHNNIDDGDGNNPRVRFALLCKEW